MAIIDLDSHLRDEYFLDEIYNLEGPFSRYTPVRIPTGDRPQEVRFEHQIPSLDKTPKRASRGFDHRYMSDPKGNWRGGEYARRQVGGYDMDRRLQDMAIEGVDYQMIFATTLSLPATAPGELGAVMCRAYNDWAARLIRGHEDRLWPVAVVPAGCPKEMPTELRRCVRELGFKAGHLVPYVGKRNLDDPAFFPYYEAAQELDVPLFCHPNTLGEVTNRFDNFFTQHVLGRPLNCTPALVSLVCGGVFERFPDLKVAFFECSAEWPLYWMHRMDDDVKWVSEDQAAHLERLPSEYVRRNCYITCEADEPRLAWALEELGADHVCFATDYPHHDSEFPHTVSTIRARDDITERQKQLILGENAASLLNLPG
jgi:predicted TIM-barrel fold metal-dependent hydrolase